MSQGICSSCKHLERTKFRSGNVRMQCSWFGFKLVSEAEECTEYLPAAVTRVEDMRHMAWILEKKKKLGFEFEISEFVRPSKGSE